MCEMSWCLNTPMWSVSICNVHFTMRRWASEETGELTPVWPGALKLGPGFFCWACFSSFCFGFVHDQCRNQKKGFCTILWTHGKTTIMYTFARLNCRLYPRSIYPRQCSEKKSLLDVFVDFCFSNCLSIFLRKKIAVIDQLLLRLQVIYTASMLI